jgi:hypothetical protein
MTMQHKLAILHKKTAVLAGLPMKDAGLLRRFVESTRFVASRRLARLLIDEVQNRGNRTRP